MDNLNRCCPQRMPEVGTVKALLSDGKWIFDPADSAIKLTAKPSSSACLLVPLLVPLTVQHADRRVVRRRKINDLADDVNRSGILSSRPLLACGRAVRLQIDFETRRKRPERCRTEARGSAAQDVYGRGFFQCQLRPHSGVDPSRLRMIFAHRGSSHSTACKSSSSVIGRKPCSSSRSSITSHHLRKRAASCALRT